MAQEVHQFTANIPANTAKASLHQVKFTMDYVEIESIDIDVPPGPSYLMGFYLAHSGQQILPAESGEFIIWDDFKDNWKLEELPTSQGWSVFGYNLDTANDHAVAIRFHTNYPSSSPSLVVPTITFVSQPLPMPSVAL